MQWSNIDWKTVIFTGWDFFPYNAFALCRSFLVFVCRHLDTQNLHLVVLSGFLNQSIKNAIFNKSYLFSNPCETHALFKTSNVNVRYKALSGKSHQLDMLIRLSSYIHSVSIFSKYRSWHQYFYDTCRHGYKWLI